jgi:predicted flap endonuclease-1-like 5' DNA nuclease
VNGLTLLVMLALGVGIFIAWRAGIVQGQRNASATAPLRPLAIPTAPGEPPRAAGEPVLAPEGHGAVGDEQARIARSLAAENQALRSALADAEAMRHQFADFAEDRRTLLRELASARGETARYRDLCIDLENNAAPPLLDGPNAPDDLKLIVGIGPVLERMLHQMGVGTYRQIARWSERDIDEFDARLPEFPGRIRRDGWVTQARELHQSKFGETLPIRDR